MKNIILSTSIFVFFSGCTSTQTAMERANKAFVGHNIDAFILRYGPPYNQQILKTYGDSRIYYFHLGSSNFYMPATAHTSGYIGAYGNYDATTTTWGGGSIELCCDVQVLTDNEGQIVSIEATRDTSGVWNTSRCAEIFK